MKTFTFWASALALAPTVLAQGLRQATGGPEPTGTPVPWYPSPEPEISDCKAELITTLCDYKPPEYGTAVASSGKAMCWEYCNEHQPCAFVIFVAGNPYTGTGTCWLYPGETFDASLGKPGCDYMSVFDKPDCGPRKTTDACEAADTPTPLATTCDYPPPDEDCFYDCAASSGSSHCVGLCAKRDDRDCNYAVFVPRNEGKSQYGSGTCWMYPTGEYDASKGKTCSGTPDQWVFKNPCPKPPKPSTTSSSPSSPTSSGGSGSGSGSDSSSGDAGSDDSSSGDNSSAAASATGAANADAQGATAGGGTKDDSNGSPATGVSLGSLLAVGLAALMW